MAQALPLLQRKPISISSCLRKPHCALRGLYPFLSPCIEVQREYFGSLPKHCQRNATTSNVSLQKPPQMEGDTGEKAAYAQNQMSGSPNPSPQGQQMLQGPTRATWEAEANAF